MPGSKFCSHCICADKKDMKKGGIIGCGTKFALIFLLLTAFLLASQNGVAETLLAGPKIIETLTETAELNWPFPIPVAESALQTVQARQWFKLPNKGHVLEGAIFDEYGNLIFCDSSNKKVMRLSPDSNLTTVFEMDDLWPTGLALHNGRLYIAAISLATGEKASGQVLSVLPDGSDAQIVIPLDAGFAPDDLLFDRHGGFYFTDFKGTATDPTGGLYYVSPEGAKITPVLKNISKANGLALSPDGKVLWLTEFANNRLHRLELADSTTLAPNGSTVPYHFIGAAPDSVRTDIKGNVYVAMNKQGRVLIFNPAGVPIGQILIPGRENGQYLKSTSLAIAPDRNQCLILSGDGDMGDNIAIFSAPTFAAGVKSF